MQKELEYAENAKKIERIGKKKLFKNVFPYGNFRR